MTPTPARPVPLLLLGGLCLAGLIVLYGFVPYSYSHDNRVNSVAGALWTMWRMFPDFQHGMIVPFLAGLVVYLRRKQLASLPIAGWQPGVVLVILTLALFWAGHRVDNQYVGFFSIQILLASLVLWLLGWRWLKALAFPLAFLVFTWPVPFLDNLITFPLRLFMSALSVGALNLIGIATIQSGTGILSAPNPQIGHAAGDLFRVDVADPCSGIRSLFALMMISGIYGNFALKEPWKRVLLFLLSVPLAIAGNLARILILTLGIITLGAPVAIGSLEHPTWFHEGAGFAVFLVALGGMLLACQILNSKPSEWAQWWRSLSTKSRPTSPSPDPLARHTPSDLY